MCESSYHRATQCCGMQFIVAILLSTAAVMAQDWPTVNRDMGRSSWTGPSVRFPLPLKKRVPIPVPKGADNISYAGGILYASVGSTPNTITAVNAATGALVWWDSVANTGGGCQFLPAISGDRVLIGGQGRSWLSSYHRVTGQLLWRKPMPSLYARQALLDNTSIYIMRDSLWRLDPATGATVWVKNFGYSTGSPALDENSVYVSSQAGISAVEKSTGNVRWAAPRSMRSYPSLVVSGGVVYASSYDTITAFSASDGTVRWAHSLEGKTLASLANNAIAITDSVLCYLYLRDPATNAAGLVGLDIRSGARLWQYPYRVEAGYVPAIVDGVVYATDFSLHHLRAIRVRDGRELFVDSTYGYDGQPIYGDGVLYVAAGNSIVPFVPASTESDATLSPHDGLMMCVSPNPFVSQTRIRIINTASAVCRVTVIDALGRRVALLHEGDAPPELTVHWDGSSSTGTPLASGLYFVAAEAGVARQVLPLLLRR